MVNTRHRGGVNDDSGEDFESLRPQRRRAAARQDVQVNGYESDDSDESPRRRRGSVKRKRNEDISPSPTRQMPPRRTTRHTETRRRSIYDRSPQRSSPEKSSRRRRVARRIEDDDDDDNDDDSDDEQPVVRRAPRRSASPSVRRSTRSRRSRYNNFDESLIEKHMALLTTGPLEPECDEDRPTKRRRSARHEVQPVEDEEETMDMYSRVKRVRKQVKRDMYGIPMTEGEDTNDESNEDEESNGEESNDEEQSETDEEPPQRKTYGLREHKPRTNFYEVPVEPHRPRNRNMDLFRDTTPPTTRGGRTRRNLDYHQSPARKRTNVPRSFSGSPASDSGAGSGGSPAGRRRRTGGRRKNKKFSHRKQSTLTKRIEIRKPKIPPSLLGRKAAFHGNSSTSSSSSESGDERRFEKRKNKSMAKSRNRCLPMNLNPEDVAAGTIRDRAKIGASMADVDPMNIDRSISFEHVGGLGKHVRSLKEMVVFPLLYPEVFERFKIQPPRGCLFYGPPGTGKTLVARALANECSTGDKKVSFFMRKGADCLSKWVGESERQLRLLFDQAYQMRPSIIFFDEIDGLAPVRSSRQDQIHSSIVSTLLALMDGLDNRGEIVIIGATNRIDSIDPALRRPGRFDREFLFPLPNVEARKQIVAIHTREWNPKLSSGFLEELAEKTVGYCGADLKALCTEAALHALRRRFPQIYTTQDKLQLDVSKIVVGAIDFHKGIQNIVPAAQRAVSSPARSLIPSIKPLLKVQLNRVLNVLCKVFPAAVVALGNLDTHGLADDLTESESDDDSVSIYEKNGRQKSQGQEKTRFLDFSSRAHLCPSTHRPRMLLAGEGGQGQTTHLAPAVLHYFERLPVHTLDLPTLYACSAKTPEESCAQVFHEAQRTSPSIIYMPHVVQWWDAISETCRATFLTLLQDQVPSTPLLLLATCESSHRDLPDEIRAMFAITADEIYVMQHPTESERMEFFSDILLSQATKPPPSKKKTATRLLEELPKAPAPEPRKLTDSELKRLQKQEEATLRELRLFLRDVLNKLGRDRKFNIFAKPVDEEDVPDYYSIIQTPMDFTTMMSKIDMHSYRTVQEFLDDINLICSNCLEYNPDSHPQDRALRHRACAMRDTAYSIITTELDEEFEKLCQEIKEARSRRGDETKKDIPSYYYTKPLKVNTQQQQPTAGTSADSVQQRPPQLHNPDTADDQKDFVKVNGKFYFKYYKKISIKKKPSSTSLPRSKSPWCKPSRRKFKRVLMYVGEDGIEYPASEVEAEAKGSAVSDNSDSDDDNNEDNVVEVNGKKYKTVMKKVALKRKSSGSKISPWCKPSRRVFRNILYYIDEDGNEFPADEINKDTKSGSGKESDRERSPSARRRSGSRQSSEAEDADMEKENLPDSGRRSRQNSPRTRPGSSPAASRSRSPRGAGHSPRGVGHSPRVPSKSPAGSPRGRSSRPNSPAAAPLSPSAAHRSPSAAHRSPITKSPRSPRSQETFKDQSPRHRRSRGGASDVEAMDVDAIKAAIENTKTLIEDRSRDTPLNPVQDNCKSADEGEKEIRLLRTRSQTNPTQAQKALQILHEKKQKMVVDTDRLNHLLDKTVSATRGHNVEKLERLYSVYSQWIYQHRLEYNKTQLIVDLEAALEKYKRY